ncbi:type II secretion system F family protein [Fretibacter rubidus]|uniref:type II secretion system F family protein n=1 Tax=Fretibacter rubidus TaxID=570162 RepID=UPI00352A3572
MSILSPTLIIYVLVFCAGFLALQVMIGAGRQAAVRVKLANDRMQRMKSESSQAIVLSKMKRARGLDGDDQIQVMVEWLGRLVLQSGLPIGQYGIFIILGGTGALGLLVLGVLKASLIWAMAGLVIGLVAPIFGLKTLVNRRRNKAVEQLPEALDVIIRSLRAGHPVPVAMALVAREMPDPIGSEFGMASDEVAFGSTVSSAIERLSDRVGHEDFELFSAMIRLQERAGGNLAELLGSNANTIRDRQRMRLKIKAASAEGRMSALILNAAPILMFLGVNKLSPSFYGDVSDNPLLTYIFWGVGIWMLIGNLVMRKMINFKI